MAVQKISLDGFFYCVPLQGMDRTYSFIIPVYNRPHEIQELLASFVAMLFSKPYEIVIVEDGSTVSSKKVVDQFSHQLSVTYLEKENSGPGDSRNYGMQRAKGSYFIILDSDCIIPRHYLQTVDDFLDKQFYDCFGGADAAHDSFSPLQKAINYTMTSFLTTGGIRGKKISVSKFEPRSFNMGLSRKAFQATGGFSKIHPGEDPDLSQRVEKLGFKTIFIPDAFVYHKRRISWKKFYEQVKKFGLVRPILNRWHPQSAKLTFWLPSLFILFVMASIVFSMVFSVFFLLPLVVYVLMVFIDSSTKSRSVRIGAMSVWAVFVQFFGYGLSFIHSSFFIGFLKRDPEKQFPKLFFK